MRNFLLCPKYNVVELAPITGLIYTLTLERYADAAVWGVVTLVAMALSSWWQVRNDKWVG